MAVREYILSGILIIVALIPVWFMGHLVTDLVRGAMLDLWTSKRNGAKEALYALGVAADVSNLSFKTLSKVARSKKQQDADLQSIKSLREQAKKLDQLGLPQQAKQMEEAILLVNTRMLDRKRAVTALVEDESLPSRDRELNAAVKIANKELAKAGLKKVRLAGKTDDDNLPLVCDKDQRENQLSTEEEKEARQWLAS